MNAETRVSIAQEIFHAKMPNDFKRAGTISRLMGSKQSALVHQSNRFPIKDMGASVSMKPKRRQVRIIELGIILLNCVIIIILLFPASDKTVPEATMDDVCLWCTPPRIKWENVIAVSILFFMAAYLLKFITARWIKFAIARKQTRVFQSKIAEALYTDRLEEVLYISASYNKSPLAFVTAASLQSNRLSQIENKPIKPSMQERQRAIVTKSADIKQRLWMLAAIGWSAPVVGLIFAGINILQALLNMRESGGTSFHLMISYFESATFIIVLGLVIAVPAIWAHKYFSAQVETFALEMDKLSLAIVCRITDHQQRLFKQEAENHFITQGLDARTTRHIAD
jgi:biopolymer transport protein ExbB